MHFKFRLKTYNFFIFRLLNNSEAFDLNKCRLTLDHLGRIDASGRQTYAPLWRVELCNKYAVEGYPKKVFFTKKG